MTQDSFGILAVFSVRSWRCFIFVGHSLGSALNSSACRDSHAAVAKLACLYWTADHGRHCEHSACRRACVAYYKSGRIRSGRARDATSL